MCKKKMSWEEKDRLLAEVYGNPPDFLESLGYTPEILEALRPTREKEAVAQSFLQKARNALTEKSYSALEFLAANPGISTIELAKRLNRGANVIGLLNAVYEEAIASDAVRETAKDLLIREILGAFPDGWSSGGEVASSIKIGGWSKTLLDFVNDPESFRRAAKIGIHLTKDHPPPEGWKPQPHNDPLIDELFDRYWPEEETQ